MATGYIVWDSKERVMVAGPFLTTAEADAFLKRRAGRTDFRTSDKSSKDYSSQFTRESVTLT